MKWERSRKDAAYLLFWPVFGLRYLLIENCNPAGQYHPVHCFLDDKIPFLEGFLIPYVLWYFCIIGVHLWLYVRNDPVYICYCKYLIVSAALSTAVFVLYPTCQELRPTVFPRDNWLTSAVSILYRLDTNTNVCPSEHVIFSAGFFLALNHSEAASCKIRLAAAVTACFTSIATVFLKQHSVLDILAAVPVCMISWCAAFRKRTMRCDWKGL